MPLISLEIKNKICYKRCFIKKRQKTLPASNDLVQLFETTVTL